MTRIGRVFSVATDNKERLALIFPFNKLEFTSICPFSVVVWHRGSLKGKMATAGLGRVGGYLEPLHGIHLTGKTQDLRHIRHQRGLISRISQSSLSSSRGFADSPELLRVLVHSDHPVVIGFTFARLPGVAHWGPRVAQGTVQHADHAVGVHIARCS